MNLRNGKTYFIYFAILLFLACQRKVEMKIFEPIPKYTEKCKNVGGDDRCTCEYGYKTCIFEDKSGDPDPYDDYKRCVMTGLMNTFCCPHGWSYNKYSTDVNCIGPKETITGYGAKSTKIEKKCQFDSHPSCRKESKVENNPSIVHICQKSNIPCNGRCYVKGDVVCHAANKCMSKYMWDCGCDDAKTTSITTTATVTSTTYSPETKEDSFTMTSYSMGLIIGVSVTALIVGSAITWCWCTRDKKAAANNSTEEDPGVFRIKDKDGKVLSDEYIRSCCGILLDRESSSGQFIAQLKRYHGTEIIERVEENEEYGYAYGLCDYETGEIVDYNVGYHAAGDSDSEGESVAEIIDDNAMYGRASTSS